MIDGMSWTWKNRSCRLVCFRRAWLRFRLSGSTALSIAGQAQPALASSLTFCLDQDRSASPTHT